MFEHQEFTLKRPEGNVVARDELERSGEREGWVGGLNDALRSRPVAFERRREG